DLLKAGKPTEAEPLLRTVAKEKDIYETEDALTVNLEMPASKGQCRYTRGGQCSQCRGSDRLIEISRPAATLYRIQHRSLSRSFRLSNKIDKARIGAALNNGVQSLTLESGGSKTAQDSADLRWSSSTCGAACLPENHRRQAAPTGVCR